MKEQFPPGLNTEFFRPTRNRGKRTAGWLLAPHVHKSLATGERAQAFTLTELLVVISIIALLIALLMPSFKKAIKSANVTKSLQNLRSIASAVNLYAADQNGTLPLAAAPGFQPPFWCGGGTPDSRSQSGLYPYLAKPSAQISPSFLTSWSLLSPLLTKSQHHPISDYGANVDVFGLGYQSVDNVNARSVASIPHPSQTAMVMSAAENDQPGVLNGTWYVEGAVETTGNAWAHPSDHAAGLILFLFVDGHTTMMTVDEYSRLGTAGKQKLLLTNPPNP